MAKNDDKHKKEHEEEVEESRGAGSGSARREEEIEIGQSEESADVAPKEDTRLEEVEAKYRRALADYQNLEKRMVEDRREWIRQANKDLLLRVLPVLDTLMLAGMHSEDKSLHISIQQFLDILKSEGITKIETKGKDFDPSVMEAVGTSEGDEGKVIEEARTGFLLHDKLLRPAQVIVGSKDIYGKDYRY
jgi:molecular chaperone GrpE